MSLISQVRADALVLGRAWRALPWQQRALDLLTVGFAVNAVVMLALWLEQPNSLFLIPIGG